MERSQNNRKWTHLQKFNFQTFDIVPLFLTFDIFGTMSFNFYYWFWTGKYRSGRLSKIEDLYDFQINLFSSFFRPPVFTVVFFSIFYYIGDTTLFCVTILKQTYKRKKQFSRSDKFLFWHHQSSLFHKSHQCYQFQLYTITETWDTKGGT